jgi:hypothetical protein
MQVRTTYFVAWTIVLIFLTLIIVPIFFALLVPAVGLFIVLIPTTIFTFSASYGMRAKDMRVPKLYFNYFEQLYPDIIAYIHAQTGDGRLPTAGDKLKWWPADRETDFCCIPFIGSYTQTNYKFSWGVALFYSLELCGYDRRVLYQFLADSVEPHAPISDEDKAEFQRVKNKVCRMCSFTITVATFKAPIIPLFWLSDKRWHYVVPETAPAGLPMVPVKDQSLDWIFKRGSLIVPTNGEVQRRFQQNKVFNLWFPIKSDEDLEKGVGAYWLAVDLRKKERI